MSTNIIESDNLSMKEILANMSNGIDHTIKNPFNNSNFKTSNKTEFEIYADEFHLKVKKHINKDINELEDLGDKLRQNTILNNYDECYKLTKHSKFLQFCDLTDDCGFNAVNYSVNSGYNRITELLINAGAHKDTKIVSDFVNIPNEVHFPKQSSFTDNFAKSMKKNFNKNGFSEDRSDKKVKISEGTTIKSDEFEKIIKTDAYAIRNNDFLEKYSNRDVRNLLINEESIDIDILTHRFRMLPSDPNINHLKESIKITLEKQVGPVSKSKIKTISADFLELLNFYRDVFLRLTEIDKVEVKDSSIHGKGIFATKKIKEGEIITFYFPFYLEYVSKDDKGIILTPVISKRQYNKDNENDLLTMRKSAINISNGFFLTGDNEYIGDTRFLGHIANDPCDFSSGNVDFVHYESEIIKKANSSIVSYTNDRRFVYLAAIKEINIGDEILVPYGARFWQIPN
jgi:hypothetical protein